MFLVASYDAEVTITAAADGSALGNPGPAGWAWVVSEDCWDAGGWRKATNNIGELTAVLQLFKATRLAGLSDQTLVIQADSQYAINAVSKWMPGWKSRGWKKADGKPVANREILEEIDRELQGRKYRFEWVRGHTGHALNELADDRAREAASAYEAGRVPSPGPGFGTDSSAVAPEPEPVPALGSDPDLDKNVIAADRALGTWGELLNRAYKNPVTIVLEDGRELLLCAASLGRTLLEETEEEPPPTLF